MNPSPKITLWYRWVAANALGELLGLGLTFAAGYAVIALLGEARSPAGSLAQFLLMTATGVIEGTIVGHAQWWAMAPYFQALTRRAWLLATIAGALAAWFLVSLPFTLMDMSAQTSGQPVQEPPLAIILLGAAGSGAIAGVILSFFQWRALRQAVPNAGVWIPANALAWALGMPLIFAATSSIQADTPPGQIALALGTGILLAGVVVGAVHGAFLVRLAGYSRVE
jgi:hypothetical protein